MLCIFVAAALVPSECDEVLPLGVSVENLELANSFRSTSTGTGNSAFTTDTPQSTTLVRLSFKIPALHPYGTSVIIPSEKATVDGLLEITTFLKSSSGKSIWYKSFLPENTLQKYATPINPHLTTLYRHVGIYGFSGSIWSESRNARTWVFGLFIVDFHPILGLHVFC